MTIAGVAPTWAPPATTSDCVAKVLPFEEGGFTLDGGLELRSLSGVEPTILPYIVFANKAFS